MALGWNTFTVDEWDGFTADSWDTFDIEGVYGSQFWIVSGNSFTPSNRTSSFRGSTAAVFEAGSVRQTVRGQGD